MSDFTFIIISLAAVLIGLQIARFIYKMIGDGGLEGTFLIGFVLFILGLVAKDVPYVGKGLMIVGGCVLLIGLIALIGAGFEGEDIAQDVEENEVIIDDNDIINIDIDKWSEKHIENIDSLITWFDFVYFEDRAIIKEFTALEVKYADEWNKVNSDLEKYFEIEYSESALNPEILAPILKISDYCCFKLLKTIQENEGKLKVSHDYHFKSIFYEKIFTQKKDTFKTVDNIFLDNIYNMTKIFYYYHFKNYKTNSSTASFEQNNQLLLDQYENILKRYNKHFSVEGLFDID